MTEKSKTTDEKWWIYRCTGVPHDGINNLPDPPPWRKPVNPEPANELDLDVSDEDANNPERGKNYLATVDQIRLVNMALYLRRPLLITGKPGTGKSSLAYSIAWELNLGPVLYWPITSRTTLADGLYRYDAIGRLQEEKRKKGEKVDIGDYLTLGPLGSAMIPSGHPRVLLIDEIDKSDIDLPNDLLNIFEEGRFEIPELMRYPESPVNIKLHKSKRKVPIHNGEVRSLAYPLVLMTSNGEREFPAPLKRRCLQLNILPPGEDLLTRIVENQLGAPLLEQAKPLIEQFLTQRKTVGHLANDQLLNAIYLLSKAIDLPDTTKEQMVKDLFQTLGSRDE